MKMRPLDQFAALLPLEACDDLGTTPQGLSNAEARARLERYGPNTLDDDFEGLSLHRLVAPFVNWITILLLVAALLAFVSATPEIGWAILVVALLNGVFTIWQEYQAEREIAVLRHLLPELTFVRRDGQAVRIPTSEVVPGDVLPLKPNTVVAADGYLIASERLRVRQTMLTGNNAPVTKVAGPLPDVTLALTERPNIMLAGTQVIEGQGTLVVVATGMRTQLGEIARSAAELRAEQSPLVRALNQLAGAISRVAIAAGLVTFLLMTLLRGLDVRDSLIFAIGMIVAFVPEGLLPTVTLALALARRRLQRHRVLVKRLADVEGLGSATVLCLDRTDTLTTGALMVSAAWAGGHAYQVTGSDYTPEGAFLVDRALVDPTQQPDLVALLRAATLCNNARLLPPDAADPRWRVLGNTTEGALLVAARKAQIDDRLLAEHTPRLQTLPYDARRQMMCVVVAEGGEGHDPVAYARGNAAAVLQLCSSIRMDATARPLDDALRADVEARIDRLARDGLRVLAVAEHRLPELPADGQWASEAVEQDMTLLGLLALQEPPQPEVAQLVEGCRRAGIRVLLTTGAYGLTAESSGRRAGIITTDRVRIVSGAELDELGDTDLDQVLRSREEVIFAQLDANAKRRIVERLQAQGEVVAFLGDSINDAPALKQADVGVALSASSTSVALAAADIVLNASRPNGLLLALEEGRALFSNIQKFSTYIFTHNVAETAAVVAAVLAGIPLPLTVVQVLAIDFGSELFPSIALSTEPPEPGALEHPPRNRNAPLIDQRLLVRSFAWLGLLQGALALLAYFMGYWTSGWRPGQPLVDSGPIYEQATTLTYAAIVMAQIGNALANRTLWAPLRQIGFLTNRALLLGSLAAAALMLTLIYVPPLATAFNFVPPTPLQWLVLSTFPVIMLLAEEGRKRWAWRRAHPAAAAGAIG